MKNIRTKIKTVAIILSCTFIPMVKGASFLGLPAYAGSGCPQGSLDFVPSEDGNGFSVIFQDYTVSAGVGSGNSGLARKNCSIAMPLHVPAGYSVALMKSSVEMDYSLPAQSSARLSLSAFFAGSQGPSFVKTMNSGFDSSSLITFNHVPGAIEWSRCGDDVILRLATSLLVRTSNRFQAAEASIVALPSMFELQWRKCK